MWLDSSRWTAFWFKRRFVRLRSGMDPLEVQTLLGNPSEAVQATVPAGSGVSLQPALAGKLAPGDQFLQWLYRRGDRHFYLWFTQDSAAGQWRLALNVGWPSVVDAPISENQISN